MIGCLSICTNCWKTLIKSHWHDPRETHPYHQVRGSITGRIYFLMLGEFTQHLPDTQRASDSFGWTNRLISEISVGIFGTEAEIICRNQNRLYISVCRFILLLICQQIELFNYLPAFYRLHSSPLTCCQGSPTISPSSSAIAPSHLILYCFLLHPFNVV